MSGRVVSEQRITLWQLHPHPQPNTDTPFSLDCLCGLHVRFAYNPYMVYCFKKIGNKRHEQIERNHKASKSLKRKPGWTDSFLKALHSTCHLFFHTTLRQETTYHVARDNAKTLYHCIKTCYICPLCFGWCCPQKGWARATLRMLTQQMCQRILCRTTNNPCKGSCKKAVSKDYRL